MHKELLILRGSPPDIDENINLLSTGEGICIDGGIGGWDAANPQNKQGVWVDSATTPGRSPVSIARGNVTENMQLIVTASSHLAMAEYLRRLGRMAEACTLYFTDPHEIRPVYLRWWAQGAPGPQFALIYQINMAITSPTVNDAGYVIRRISLEVERESAWRGVEPGASPGKWQEQVKSLPYISPAEPRGYLNPENVAEYQPYIYQRIDTSMAAPVTNAVTGRMLISGKDIVGDAPPIFGLSYYGQSDVGPISAGSIYHFGFKKQSALQTKYLVPAFDGTVASSIGTSFSVISGNRITANPAVNATKYYTNNITLDTSAGYNIAGEFKGRYAVFAVGTSSAGNVVMSAEWFIVEDTATTPINAPIAKTAEWTFPTTSEPTALYVGTIDLPGNESEVHNRADYTSELYLRYTCLRAAGAGTATLDSIVYVPIDHGLVVANAQQVLRSTLTQPTGTRPRFFNIDTSGYPTLGKPELYAGYAWPDPVATANVKGSEPYIEPGKDFTISAFVHYTNGTFAFTRIMLGPVAAQGRYEMVFNFIPRWYGIRDV